MAESGRIRAGIGGWDYDPWRQTFYPADVPKKKQLEYASRQLTAIEVNGTFYRLQTPAVFAKWRDEAPDDFVFCIKAPRYIVQRKVLADAGSAIERFLNSGLTELGPKLGPILWQMQPSYGFDTTDLERFFELLPATLRGVRLRHALEVRHKSFLAPELITLARRFNIGTVFVDSDSYPRFADVTADFTYARLRRAQAEIQTGYSEQALDEWVDRARAWARGGVPADLARVDSTNVAVQPRDVFMFFINGAKERAPAAAMRLIAKLGTQ
ncbi:MAG: DUF72 domain-containing protein [Steroidobacteraceae bacterium]